MSLQDYGLFEEGGRVFRITRPDTPAPWVNYIGNGRLMGLVSHTGGGYTYWRCPRDSRITRHRYNALPWDRPGRYLYIRNEEGRFWSPTWQPVPLPLDAYSCRHSMGWTAIESGFDGIRASVLYFVPPDDDVEIWRVRLSETQGRGRDLRITSYVELCLGHALVDLINQPNDQHFNRTHWDSERQILFATKDYWVQYRTATVAQPNQAWDREVFFATSLPVETFDSRKDTFIGRWRSESDPEGVERGRLRNTEITAGDACAALQSSVMLGPGEQTEFTVLLGVVPRGEREAARRLVELGRDPVWVEGELRRVEDWWSGFLDALEVQTPDPDVDVLMNYWLRKQTWATYHATRSAGYYHGGLLFGTGVRDSAQDLLGPIIAEPAMAEGKILNILRHQFSDGSTLHNWFPLTDEGEKTGHSDTPLWIPLAVTSYIRETGDFSYLERRAPWQDGGEDTVLEHLVRSLDYTLQHRMSPRNLPLFGPGDWNDTLDYVGRKGIGESVWVAEFLCYGLRETAGLLRRTGQDGRAEGYERWYAAVADAVNTLAWDGEWYVRGFRDDGGVIGSSRNTEGRIFLNAQSWAVISGVAPPDRARLAMDSARRLCGTSRGPKILAPAYRTVDPGIGLATRCVPGKKENGAVFNHPVSWAILAEAMLGNAGRAWEYFRQTMPMTQASDPDIYLMEPYVYSEYVTSDEHPEFGQASHSWLTGSAVWMFRAMLDWILGVRPDYDGLTVSPLLPPRWPGARVRRRFRGCVYDIRIVRDAAEREGPRILLDGTPHAGPLPVGPAGTVFRVECRVGTGDRKESGDG